MPYTHRILNSIDGIDLSEWQRVGSASGASLDLDYRFIAAVESGMKESCRFWHVVIHDENGISVACASLSAVTLDLANLAHPRLASFLRRLPRALSWLRTPRILVCGLPVSVGEHSLALTSSHDSPNILAELDRVISELASQERVKTIVYKEFAEDDLPWANTLLTLGYRRIASLPNHLFRPAFRDFGQYRSALRSHYRYKVNRSLRKLERAGVEILVLTNPQDIIRLYTPEVHSLYHQILQNSATRFETLSIEFFHELTLRFKDEIELVVLSRASEVIAFGWCLKVNSIFYMLYAGLNYAMNAELDLYFNLMYAWLDRALRSRPSKIVVGQTAGAFKARLGCYSEPLYAFSRGVGPLMSLVNRFIADLAVAQEPAARPARVFKT